jgi:hypothetical protein
LHVARAQILDAGLWFVEQLRDRTYAMYDVMYVVYAMYDFMYVVYAMYDAMYAMYMCVMYLLMPSLSSFSRCGFSPFLACTHN